MSDEMDLKEAVTLLLTERPECSDCGYQDIKLRKCALYGCDYARALISVIRKVEKDLEEEAKHIHDLEDIDEMVEKMNRNFKDRCFKETINNIIKTTKGDTK